MNAERKTRLKIVDLTQPIHSGMDIYPGDPEVEIDIAQSHGQDGWELRKMSMGSHTGTHVDAPVHAHEGARNLDQVSLSQFCGEAVCLGSQAPLPDGIGLVFRDHLSAALKDDILASRAPFVAAPSLDEDLERDLLADDVITFDGIINTDQLPVDTRFLFVGLPLRIKGGDGSPVRAVAILNET